MKRSWIRILLICFAVLLVVFALLRLARQPQPPLPADAAEQARAEPAALLDAVLVHGEAAQLSLADLPAETTITLIGSDSARTHGVRFRRSAYANQGLILYRLPAAVYHVYADGGRVDPGAAALPSGYTLPRDGMRKHWRFFTDDDGFLALAVRETDDLPAGYYDVILDPGHGGADLGAVAHGYQEAALNLENSLLMKAYLEAYGLKVALTRESAALPGGDAAEDNPYLPGARLDRIYSSHACYLFSNHLNGGSGRDAGFQIYSSVATDSRFADSVAGALRAAGASENNGGAGLVANGVYKRPSEVYSETKRDYYFILRESGGYALSPFRCRLFNSSLADALYCGPEGLLMEYAFLDNAADLRHWLDNRETLLRAAVDGAAAYWEL